MTSMTFEGFGLPDALAEALARMNYTTPTPIQAQSIPFALDGRDIMGSAQTGTGKTAAFTIPMIAALMEDQRACAVVLTPTRELAMQVMDVARQMIPKGSNIRAALLIGGEPMGKQFKQLNDRPRLIIGTPGRVNDHLRRQPDLFEFTSFVVLDEADRMLDMGFSVQIDTILDACRAQRQTLMFSATFPAKIEKFARTYLQNPQRVEIEADRVTAENISHEVTQVSQDGKYDVLRAELEARMGSIIVFVKTKRGADKLAGRLQGDGHDATPLHGGLNQRQRERATRAFRKMDFRVLIATDVAARGLDIPHVEHVINYDMPMVAEDYVHRIGRTARAGAKGNALAMVSPADRGLWMDVERIMYPDRAPAPRSRDDRDSRGGEGRKPFRKGPFKQGGFKKRSEGGNDRASYGGERKSFGGERKSYGDRPRGPRPDGQRSEAPQVNFRKREDGGDNRGNERGNDRGGERNYAGRTSFNDRPRGPRPEGGQGNFRKREDGERSSFGGERKSYGDRPQGDRPQGDRPAPKKYDGHKSEGGFARGGDKPRGDKPFSGKPRSDKPFAGKPRSDKPYAGKPRSDKPRSDKPQGGARRGAARYNNGGAAPAKGNGGQTFRKRTAA